MTVIDITAALEVRRAHELKAVEQEIASARRLADELEQVAAGLRSEQGRLFDGQDTGT